MQARTLPKFYFSCKNTTSYRLSYDDSLPVNRSDPGHLTSEIWTPTASAHLRRALFENYNPNARSQM